jgi:uncharacterized protein YkwD
MRGALRAGIGAALMGLSVTALPGTAVAAPAGCTVTPAQADEVAMNRLIAVQRKAAKAPRVRVKANLRKAGRAKSLAMARGAAFAHEGVLPWADGRKGGQNIAMASSAEIAFKAMLASPGHRANILARDWRFAGVGAARTCDGQVFFTLNFLGPA